MVAKESSYGLDLGLERAYEEWLEVNQKSPEHIWYNIKNSVGFSFIG